MISRKNRLNIFHHFLHFVVLISAAVIFVLTGCVNPVEGPPPDQLAPVITIFSPLSNDTIYVGQTPIYYEAKDDYGLSHYEIYVNDTLVNTYEQPLGSPNASIFLNFGSNELYKIFSYYVIAYDLSGNKTSSDPVTGILVDKLRLPPQAPNNLTLNKISDRIFNLIWSDESEDELFFELWRNEDTSAFELIRYMAKNSISTNDTIPFPNLPYSYVIKASNEYGKSESNIVTSIPNSSELIHAPSNLNGTSYGTSRIKLTWKDNSTNELAFKIERKISSSNAFEQIAVTNANDTVYFDTDGLFTSTEYTYRIAAVGEFSLSNWSNLTTIPTLSFDINPPNNLNVSYSSINEAVVLNWTDNSIFDIETRIERSGADKIFTEIGIAGQNITKYLDSTVTTGQSYFYRIRSYTVGGYFSEYSAEVEIQL